MHCIARNFFINLWRNQQKVTELITDDAVTDLIPLLNSIFVPVRDLKAASTSYTMCIRAHANDILHTICFLRGPGSYTSLRNLCATIAALKKTYPDISFKSFTLNEIINSDTRYQDVSIILPINSHVFHVYDGGIWQILPKNKISHLKKIMSPLEKLMFIDIVDEVEYIAWPDIAKMMLSLSGGTILTPAYFLPIA